MLHSSRSGSGYPVILIHGLFGMGDNLSMVARALEDRFTVYRLDLPNHGRSPRTTDMSFPTMARAVLEFMDREGIECAHFLGHSLGGKVSMQLALSHPERVNRLIVADIAPVAYAGHHDQILAAFDAVELSAIASRRDAEVSLKAYIEEDGVRMFILKNLYKNAEGQFDWRLNVPVIKQSYDQLRKALDADGVFPGETLFLKGELSAYIQDKHWPTIQQLFPKARIKVIQNTGHWLHAEKPDTFNKLTRDFLLEEATDSPD